MGGPPLWPSEGVASSYGTGAQDYRCHIALLRIGEQSALQMAAKMLGAVKAGQGLEGPEGRAYSPCIMTRCVVQLAEYKTLLDTSYFLYNPKAWAPGRNHVGDELVLRRVLHFLTSCG